MNVNDVCISFSQYVVKVPVLLGGHEQQTADVSRPAVLSGYYLLTF